MWTATANGSRAMPSATMIERITSPPPFAGLVLAGGASSRMGEDKACLNWQGRTLLDHAMARLAEAGADPVLVSGDRPGRDSIPDAEPGRGPLGGLLTVLQERPGLGDRILAVTPVDSPGLSPDALLALVHCVADGARAACYQGHPLPMALRASTEVTDCLRELLGASGGAPVKALAKQLGARSLASDHVDLSNINTPAEWTRFREATP